MNETAVDTYCNALMNLRMISNLSAILTVVRLTEDMDMNVSFDDASETIETVIQKLSEETIELIKTMSSAMQKGKNDEN